ncbi:tyrosine-type recombinase/integrase [uncultured Methanomethylovorans sp.]|uniref:tyrosine-type recombinase/integrase n=1 Tax=uncultured Methanomethylovorans sp. TaxID=183759 RepID=UPI0026096C01|nr:tyrosine-type recombinase/integrase [uncultured Methanomethylovorans sp.]
MTRNVDDVHAYDSGFIKAMTALEALATTDHNKTLVKAFVMSCKREGLAKSTITNYVNLLKRMIERLQETGFCGDLDQLEQTSFDVFIMHLEDVVKLSPGEVRNYKKVTKKFYGTLYEGDAPKWVRQIKLKSVETPVQPSDLPTQEEVDQMLAACTNPRDRALIAVLVDSGMRVGALASCRVKNVVSNEYGAMIYISTTSRSKKTSAPKGLPLTWSAGFLQQWIGVHPLRDNPEAPLWVTLDKNQEPLSYKTIRVTVKNIAKRAGIKRRIHTHLFRHKAITNWILEGFNEQTINHRAGWSKGSTQMFKIYANFTDHEMNDAIYEKYGLKHEDKRHVTLKKCPRCNNVLRPSDKFCSQCSLVLDRQALDEIKQYEDRLPEILQLVMKSEKARAMLSNVEKS